MKILHLNTYAGGGAANAAMRLHQGLRKIGILSKMLFLFADDDTQRDLYGYLPLSSTEYSQSVERENAERLLMEKQKHGQPGRIECEILTFPTTSFRDLDKHPLVLEADIIHLHWIARFVDFPSFFALVNKPIVWTLHDMNPILGLFHYRNDSLRNVWLDRYEKEIQMLKAKSIGNYRKIKLVTPSKWLAEEVHSSDVFNYNAVDVISNSVNLDLFRPLEGKDVLRQALGLPKEQIVVLFVAALNVERKRFDLFCRVANQFLHDDRIAFCCVGEKFDLPLPANMISLGGIKNERFLPIIYNAVDATCVCSDEDNLPNVILESMACGVPVFGVPHGGIQEYINHSTGICLSSNRVEVVAEEIELFLQGAKSFSQVKIREYAVSKFSQDLQARKYIEIYSSAINC